MIRLLLLTLFLIVACGPRPPVAIQPTVTPALSLGAQKVADQQTATAAVESGRMTELEIISATEAASIRQAEMDLSAQQADVDRQNAITENMIKVWADQTAVAVKHEDTNAIYAQATAQINSAYAQATAAIVEANTRREIEAEDHRFDFGTWLMIAGLFIAGATVCGAFLRVYRSLKIGEQEDESRALVVREQRPQTRIAESTAMVAHHDEQRAQNAAWVASEKQLADGRVYILVLNERTQKPEPHWIIEEPIALPTSVSAARARKLIEEAQQRKANNGSRVVRKEDISLDDPVSVQHELTKFIRDMIGIAGVDHERLLRHSHLKQYESGAWTRLTDVLETNKLIIKIPRRHTLVNPDGGNRNLGELLTHITNRGIFLPNPPPNGDPLKSPQQAVNTGKTAETDENRGNGAGG